MLYNVSHTTRMDYTKKSLPELKELCREKGVKGFSTKKKAELIELLKSKESPLTQSSNPIQESPVTMPKDYSKTALSLFSGAGGDTCGLEAAGWTVRNFSEFNAKAVDTHKAAFPSSELLTGTDKSIDIKKIPDETFVKMRGGIGLVFAGFPCFPAGTKVLTDSGYKNIEKVVLEDKLLTHSGKFQRIINLQSKMYSGDMYHLLLAHNVYTISATPEHPFLVRTRTTKWNWKVKQYEYSFSEPTWKEIKDITPNDYCGMVNSYCIKGEHHNDKLYYTKESALEVQAALLSEGNYTYIDVFDDVYTLEYLEESPDICFKDGEYTWFSVSMIRKGGLQFTDTVYNFEVEEDNSYIVENTIVHNCQGFSHAGKKKTDDPRNELVHEFVRVAKLVQPEWIVGENVRGLLSRKGVYPPGSAARPIIEIIKELFEGIGYKTTWRVIDATEVGVPQLRKRLIIIGHRGSDYPHIPWNELPMPKDKPTIRSLLGTTLEGAVELPELYKPSEQHPRFWIQTSETSVKGVSHPNMVRLVAGIRNLSSKELKEQNKTEKEQFVEPKGLISFGTRAGGYHGQVLDPDAPCKTIICAYNQCPRLFVGLHNPSVGKYWVRCLTPEECGLIQGFPGDYPWQGNVKEKITQIGNAVPPPLATAIAKLIEKATFHKTPQRLDTVDTAEDSEDE